MSLVFTSCPLRGAPRNSNASGCPSFSTPLNERGSQSRHKSVSLRICHPATKMKSTGSTLEQPEHLPAVPVPSVVVNHVGRYRVNEGFLRGSRYDWGLALSLVPLPHLGCSLTSEWCLCRPRQAQHSQRRNEQGRWTCRHCQGHQ